jgi:hypothetical protein
VVSTQSTTRYSNQFFFFFFFFLVLWKFIRKEKKASGLGTETNEKAERLQSAKSLQDLRSCFPCALLSTQYFGRKLQMHENFFLPVITDRHSLLETPQYNARKTDKTSPTVYQTTLRRPLLKEGPPPMRAEE